MAAIAAEFDLHSFAYLAMPTTPTQKPRLISTYAEPWTTHYLSRRYENADPVILPSLRDSEPFDWGPDLAAVNDNTRSSTRRPASAFATASQFRFHTGKDAWRRSPSLRIAAAPNTAPASGITHERFSSSLISFMPVSARIRNLSRDRWCFADRAPMPMPRMGEARQIRWRHRAIARYHTADHHVSPRSRQSEIGRAHICQAAIAFDHASGEFEQESGRSSANHVQGDVLHSLAFRDDPRKRNFPITAQSDQFFAVITHNP